MRLGLLNWSDLLWALCFASVFAWEFELLHGAGVHAYRCLPLYRTNLIYTYMIKKDKMFIHSFRRVYTVRDSWPHLGLCKTYTRTNRRIAQGEEVSRRPLGWLMWPCASSSGDMETTVRSESGGVKPAGIKYPRAGNERSGSVQNMQPSSFVQFVSRVKYINTRHSCNIPLKGDLWNFKPAEHPDLFWPLVAKRMKTLLTKQLKHVFSLFIWHCNFTGWWRLALECFCLGLFFYLFK